MSWGAWIKPRREGGSLSQATTIFRTHGFGSMLTRGNASRKQRINEAGKSGEWISEACYGGSPDEGRETMREHAITDEQLVAYLQEELPLAELASLERALRSDRELGRRAARLASRRDLAGHSVGAIWRAERLSCPNREELGAYLLGALDEGRASYISFHLRSLGCRYCGANLADLQASSRQGAGDEARRRRYFESSAGHLRDKQLD